MFCSTKAALTFNLSFRMFCLIFLKVFVVVVCLGFLLYPRYCILVIVIVDVIVDVVVGGGGVVVDSGVGSVVEVDIIV